MKRELHSQHCQGILKTKLMIVKKVSSCTDHSAAWWIPWHLGIAWLLILLSWSHPTWIWKRIWCRLWQRWWFSQTWKWQIFVFEASSRWYPCCVCLFWLSAGHRRFESWRGPTNFCKTEDSKLSRWCCVVKWCLFWMRFCFHSACK